MKNTLLLTIFLLGGLVAADPLDFVGAENAEYSRVVEIATFNTSKLRRDLDIIEDLSMQGVPEILEKAISPLKDKLDAIMEKKSEIKKNIDLLTADFDMRINLLSKKREETVLNAIAPIKKELKERRKVADKF